jgi:thiol-disulfide isomerase/thioredoxin
MKKLAFLITFILFSWIAQAQEVGIRFEDSTFDESLAKARASGRFLFIDCFTTWCGPCKQLEKEVFPNPEVAEYFNSKFINLRIDVEKGEGPELRKRFGVQPVPTLLFINADGMVEHKFIGTYPPDEFIKKSDEVFNNENRYGVLKRKYDSGIRSLELMSAYTNELLSQSEYDNAKGIISMLMSERSPDSLCTISFWPQFTQGFVAEFNSGYYDYLIEHRELWIKSIGQKIYDNTMASLYKRYTATWIFSGAKRGDESVQIERARADIKSLSLEEYPELMVLLDISLARVKGDYDLFTSLIEENYELLSDEDKYVIFVDSSFFPKEATVVQCSRYLSLIRKFLAGQKDEKYNTRLARIVQSLELIVTNSK